MPAPRRLGTQQPATWLRKWVAACALLRQNHTTFVDDNGDTVVVTPERLTSNCKHNYWIDQAYASWAVEDIRAHCDEEGILRLLEAQGWVRKKP